MRTVLLSLFLTFSWGLIAGDVRSTPDDSPPAEKDEAASAQPAESESDAESSSDEPAGSDHAAQPEAESASDESADEPAAFAPAAEDDAQNTTTAPVIAAITPVELRPRVELYIPSVRHLVAQAERSHAGRLAHEALAAVTSALSHGSESSLAAGETVLRAIAAWPDTSFTLLTFAPDTLGRARWGVAVDWSLDDLRQRMLDVMKSDVLAEALEGVSFVDRDGAAALVVEGEPEPLCLLIARPQGGSMVRSAAEFDFPADVFGWSEAKKTERSDTSTLVYCRTNLSATEHDSTALFGSQISWFRDIEYRAAVDAEKNWNEDVAVSWNLMVGAGVKAMIDRARQSFYVPREAFGAAVLNSPALMGMLDVMAGLEPGTLGGGVGSRVGPEVCMMVLPGDGILPFPDFVLKARARYSDAIVKNLRAAIEKANKQSREQDHPEAWHETTVDDHVVIYHDGRRGGASGMGAATYRTVLFIDSQTDPKGRQRDIIHVGFTSTSPEGLVRRLLRPLPEKDRIAVPDAAGNSAGQAWVHWKRIYAFASPWINLGIAGVAPEGVIAPAEELADSLADADVRMDIKFNGMTLAHRGPLPFGAVYLPITVAGSLAGDRGGDTDLSRERVAVERLMLFYEHAKLFHKDFGRWPARVAELDGYIDFAGHPYLLQLKKSSRPRWIEKLREAIDEEEDEKKADDADTEDEEEQEIDDSAFVVKWSGDEWTLGVRPRTFMHLLELYIDEKGEIHRRPKPAGPATPAEATDDGDSTTSNGI